MSEWIRCPMCGALMATLTSGHMCPCCGYRVPAQTVTHSRGTSAEYVEIVRCKDCAKWRTAECSMAETEVLWEFDYCSYAERKEE